MSRIQVDGRVLTNSAALMASVLALGTTHALAQGSGATGSMIEEVVVTAQKREERLQDVSFAISAISNAQIEARGIDNLLDLSAVAPNLTVSKYPAAGVASQVAIRGAVTVNATMNWDPSVGLYLDGVYLGKAVGSVFDVVDVERIEVLRGPQGTLYGRNTMAGAINLITRAPSGEFEGSASVEVGNYDHHVEKLSVDLPKMGIARVSFGVRSEERDGLVKLSPADPLNSNPGSPGVELDSRNRFGARFALGLDFSDNFVADYRFDYTEFDQTPPHNQLYSVDPSSNPLFTNAAAYASTKRLGTVSTNWLGFEELELEGHSLTLQWDVNDSNTLKSISAYRTLHHEDSTDLDGVPLTIVTLNREQEVDQKSQELQWIGNAGQLNYVLGAYYYEEDGYTINPHVYFFGTDEPFFGFEVEAVAVYGQLDYELTEALTLSAGMRWTQEDKDIVRYKAVARAGTPIPRVTADESFSATTPMASVSYKVNDGLNLYVRYSEGFKSGGFPGEASSALESVTPYDPEEQMTWEVGAKMTSADGRLQVNAALFRNDIEDMQVNHFTGVPGSSVIRNAGEARTQGGEIEATWYPVEALRLQLSYGYLDAEWKDYMEAAVPGQPITNVADNRSFPQAPEHTVGLLAEVKLAQMSWGELRGLADYSYTSSMYMYAYQLETVDPGRATASNSKVDSLGLLNLRLTLADIGLGESGTGEFSLWARNVTDEEQPMNFIDFGPGFFAGYTLAYFQEPRTYGATFTYRW